jgi:hypothetical protein
MKTICILAIILTPFLSAFGDSPPVDEQPLVKLAFNAFLSSVKQGNEELTIKSIYHPPGSEKQIESRARGLVQKSKAKGTVPEYVDAKAQVSIAIVFMKDVVKKPDGKPDFDAVTLIKRGGKWLVVLGNAEIEDRADVLTSAERKQLAELREWQDTRMHALSPSN